MGSKITWQETTEWHCNTKSQSEFSGKKFWLTLVNLWLIQKWKIYLKNFTLRCSSRNVLKDCKRLFSKTGTLQRNAGVYKHNLISKLVLRQVLKTAKSDYKIPMSVRPSVYLSFCVCVCVCVCMYVCNVM